MASHLSALMTLTLPPSCPATTTGASIDWARSLLLEDPTPVSTPDKMRKLQFLADATVATRNHDLARSVITPLID
jgi:hypothetical protein